MGISLPSQGILFGSTGLYAGEEERLSRLRGGKSLRGARYRGKGVFSMGIKPPNVSGGGTLFGSSGFCTEGMAVVLA
jgi:hypothetical protein